MASKVSRRRPPPSAYSFRRALQETDVAKNCYFFKEGDYKFSGIKMVINPRKYRGMGPLYSDLSSRVRLPYGVRRIFTPRGRSVVRSIEGFEHEGHYVCSTSYHNRGQPFDIARVSAPLHWKFSKPSSGQRDLNSILHDAEFDEIQQVKPGRFDREKKMANAYNRSHPKKITILRNGDPSQRHILLLNRRTAQTFEQILDDLNSMFKDQIERLFTMEGRKIMSLNQLFNGPESLVVAGKERFIRMGGFDPQPPPGPLKPTHGGSLLPTN